jgi:hypothetical protein
MRADSSFVRPFDVVRDGRKTSETTWPIALGSTFTDDVSIRRGVNFLHSRNNARPLDDNQSPTNCDLLSIAGILFLDLVTQKIHVAYEVIRDG